MKRFERNAVRFLFSVGAGLAILAAGCESDSDDDDGGGGTIVVTNVVGGVTNVITNVVTNVVADVVHSAGNATINGTFKFSCHFDNQTVIATHCSGTFIDTQVCSTVALMEDRAGDRKRHHQLIAITQNQDFTVVGKLANKPQ